MKYQIKINKINTVDEIKEFWSKNDYIELLDKFNYQDAASADESELRDLLLMAISDYEPDEAATIILGHILSDQLSEGQIEQLSHEMQEDKVAEEYPEIPLQQFLFHANQLLFKAYNGKFPSVKASIIDFSIRPIKENIEMETSKELVLKAFTDGLSERCVLKRLFAKQLAGELEFPEADGILWEFEELGDSNFRTITSAYWIDKEDFLETEFEGNVLEFVKVEED